ncbi:MAG: hypothetical protein V1760_02285 [Candidatus Peregrinibacteria bacterium]
MKIKLLVIIGFIAAVILAQVTQAKTPVTGTAYNPDTGRIHMDYTTSIRPEDVSNPSPDFYIGPLDENFTGPGLTDFTVQIYDFGDRNKCTTSYCLLTGFMWNDVVGWVILDGQVLQSGMENPEDFPETSFARINFTGSLEGFIWSQHAGWVKLSAEEGGTTTPTLSQSQSDWGAFLDPRKDVVTIEREGEEDLVLGRPLQGYAWGEYLGWIKLEKRPEDSTDFGVYTTWVPDLSPPNLYIENNVWFANNREDGAITWPNIAYDPESGISTDAVLTVTVDPEFTGCNQPTDIGYSYTGGYLSLTIPSIGLLQSAPNGYCKYTLRGEIHNNAGLTYEISDDPEAESRPFTFYVRAGNYQADKSEIATPTSSTAVADGADAIVYWFKPKDIAENPIVSIDCDECRTRTVTATAMLENEMRYDTIALVDSFPVKVNEAFLSQHGTFASEPLLEEAGKYPIEITSFAPTLTDINTFTLNDFKITVEDESLPRITMNHSGTAYAKKEYTLNNPTPELNFEPALIAGNSHIKTGDLTNEVIDGLPATLNFDLTNQSNTKTLDTIDFDTIFEFYTDAGGMGSALIETRQIDHPSGAPDTVLGWSDPTAATQGAHYEILSGTDLNGTNSIFRALQTSADGTSIPENLQSDGSYEVDEDYGIPGNRIDRSDAIGMNLGTGGTSTHAIVFTPAYLFIPTTLDINDVNLRIQQKIAYRFPDQPEFTLYEPDFLVSDVRMNATGVKLKGLAAGEDIYTNGNLDVIGKKGLERVAEQMRRNAAGITSNLQPCNAGTALTTETGGTLTLKTSGSCIKVDENNNTIVAFYKGNPDELLELGAADTTRTIYIPRGYRYTLVLSGGMELFLKNNIVYETLDTESSFGMIVLKENGEGGNVYLHPNPTNIAGSLFAEGSLLSSPNPGAGALYYGGSANAQDLKNQLYWQGSIASLNTIGGAKNRILPEGVSCEETGITPYECAQRYDMNFLRRFSASETAVANDGKFSGGGSCTPLGSCTHGLLGSAHSTIQLDAENHIDKNASKSIDTFFIEPENRPAPPGFTLTTEQESIEVIR